MLFLMRKKKFIIEGVFLMAQPLPKSSKDRGPASRLIFILRPGEEPQALKRSSTSPGITESPQSKLHLIINNPGDFRKIHTISLSLHFAISTVGHSPSGCCMGWGCVMNELVLSGPLLSPSYASTHLHIIDNPQAGAMIPILQIENLRLRLPKSPVKVS